MDDTLPSEFDLIVVGTGFTESIVAAAASRVGKTVLHLDANDFYGGHWASFNLENLLALATDSQAVEANQVATSAVPIDDRCQLRNGPFRLQNVRQYWAPEPAAESVEESLATEAQEVSNPAEAEPKEAVEDTIDADVVVTAPVAASPSARELALKSSRRFNIDLTPKLLYARGELVELLISSNICRYSEFRAVDRVCTWLPQPDATSGAAGHLRPVPCSRSDIFTSREVSVVEKRQLSKHLMALLSLGAEDTVHQEYAGRTFREYLLERRLSEKCVHYVLRAIAMCGEQASFAEGAERTKRFLQSAERYGSTPFLFAMYGCGELPQCFCRLCAVFGGVYCLKRPIGEVHHSADGQFEAITCGEQRISAKAIVFGAGTTAKSGDAAADAEPAKTCGQMSRGILLSRAPFGDAQLNSGGGGVILLKLPAVGSAVVEAEGGPEDGAQVVQLSHYSGTCPKDWYLIHLTCKSSPGNDPERDLAPYVAQLNASSADNQPLPIVWSMFFTIPACGQCASPAQVASSAGVHHLCGAYFELDYDQSIAEARRLFATLYTDAEEFLPRAPDPEEIIVAGSDEDDEIVGQQRVENSVEAHGDPDVRDAEVGVAVAEAATEEEVAEEACV